MNDSRSLVHVVSGLLHTTGGRKAVTLILLVIDKSGSMHPRREAVIEMVDSVVRDAQKVTGAEDAFIAIITFNDSVEVMLPPTPLMQVGAMTTYVPTGSTALYAASDDTLGVGLSFDDGLKRLGGGAPTFRCNVIVLSDGGDNQSGDRQASAQAKARQARERGFELRAIGIGIDHQHLSEQLGFDASIGVTVEATKQGMRDATTHMSESISHTLTGEALERAMGVRPIDPTGSGSSKP